ncbi:hypothetical protein QWY85_07830 [Neolewinella lacunae]|uniref:Peptidase M10 metallopeptidase domain-containing protein n=1 Tax=Neolewinella lacunae TaxID=1517758 RepID=A0A923T8L0_9BACT|nr:hypothetical protein [Neolewinella lacunae]MBC6994689.1 hypothetical protein [Neolewinella lacunae]MDN3634561.1 hypothetical protein [Neolewinella lacunae]
MLNHLTTIIIICLAIGNSLASQSAETLCGTDSTQFAQPRIIQKNLYEFCNYSESYINNNCLTTYIRVNVHFFVESDCSGTTAAAAVNNQLQQSEVFQKAEDYIGNANTFLSIMSGNQQWNQLEWGATVTDTQCVMLRLVLNEVFIHCETGNRVVGVQLSQSDDVVSYDTANYGSALNVFITNVQGGANGFVYLDLGNTTIFNENFHSQLLIHEIGHSLKLKHPFQGVP